MDMLKETNSINLDDVLIQFKVFGRYHLKLIVLIFLAYVTNSMYTSNFVFVTEDVGYRCKLPKNNCEQSNMNATSDDVIKQCEIKIPKDPRKSCDDKDNIQVISCTDFIYNDPTSFVAEFQLACHEFKRTLVGSVHSGGYMVGLLIAGPASDRFGRKKVLIVMGVAGAIIGFTRSFLINYWLYVVLEFLEGVIGDCYSPMFMIAMEATATKNRGLFYMFADSGYPTGGMLKSLIAYSTDNWRNYLRAMYAPSFLFLLYIYLIDESPRWLLANGKKDEAIQILKKAAKLNKIEIEDNVLQNLKSEDLHQGTVSLPVLVKETFSSRIIVGRFFVCIVWWTTSTFTNFGMEINAVGLAGNKYLNIFLLYAIDLPASLFMGLVLTRFSRKRSLFTAFFVSAMFCFIQPFMPENKQWLGILLLLISKFTSSLYFTMTYVFTSELFPTYTRNSMHGLCSSIGRIGSIVAPQTPLLNQYWAGLPSLLFGGMAFIAAMLTLLIPDTFNTSLPDNVAQAEAVGKKDNVAQAEAVDKKINQNQVVTGIEL